MAPLEHLRAELSALDWTQGLTRDQLRQQIQDFPELVYLELPASKRFYKVDELLHEAANASNRAEGEGTGKDFDSFDAEGAENEGGPRAWGEDPLYGES